MKRYNDETAIARRVFGKFQLKLYPLMITSILKPSGRSFLQFAPSTFSMLTTCVVSGVALMFGQRLLAQSGEAKFPATAAVHADSTVAYSMKFTGGSVDALEQELKAAFPKDNVVVTPSARNTKLNVGDFEIRDVSLHELAKSIEFVSDSKLIVEVSEGGGADAKTNIWRIGSRLATIPSTLMQLKMCSVATPNLFVSEKKVERVKHAAEKLEKDRLQRILDSTRAGFNEIVGGARIELLPDQNIMVIVGSEDGVSGIESFIKAAEKLAADEIAEQKATTMARRAEEKAREDLARKAKDDEIAMREQLEARRLALKEQMEATIAGSREKEVMMDERFKRLKDAMEEKRKALEEQMTLQKDMSESRRNHLRAELDAIISNSTRILAEEEVRNAEQMERLKSNLIDLNTELRILDSRLNKQK